MNLRTFDRYHYVNFDSFKTTTNDKSCLNYQNIGFDVPTNNTFVIIENLLSNDECQEILDKTANLYTNLKMEYLTSDRSAERFLNMNKSMATCIYDRIKHIVEEEHEKKHLKPYGFGTDGKWMPTGINQCFRHSKYESPSIGFTFHRDSCYVENLNLRSVLSLVIYLNDDFDGGETLFVKSNAERKIGQIVSEELTEGYEILYKFKPRRGHAILFNHDIIHSGMPIHVGIKYIIRSDILFTNTTPTNNYDFQNNEFFLQAVEYYREANNQEMKGNVKAASELYERGLSLRQFH
jgi:hypothetical protein